MRTKYEITVADIGGSRITIPAGTRTVPAHNLPNGIDNEPKRWVVVGRWATPEQRRQWASGIILDWREVKYGPNPEPRTLYHQP